MGHRRLEDIGTDPDYRYSLANERTFLSWIRTSLAILAGGVVVIELAPNLGPRPMRLAIGLALIVGAGALAARSHTRWLSAERAMRLRQPLPPTHTITVLGYVIAIVVVVLVVTLVLAGRV